MNYCVGLGQVSSCVVLLVISSTERGRSDHIEMA